MEEDNLWKNEGSSLLLLRDSVQRAASTCDSGGWCHGKTIGEKCLIRKKRFFDSTSFSKLHMSDEKRRVGDRITSHPSIFHKRRSVGSEFEGRLTVS